MKKRKLLIAVLSIMLVVTLCLGLVACDDKDKEETVTLTSVSVVGNPVYYIEDFDLSKLKLKLTYSNNTEEVVAFDANLVSKEDKEKLVFLDDADNDGKEDKTISFTYNGNAVTFTFSMQHNPSVELKTFDTVKLESKEFYYSEKDFRKLEVTGLPTLEDGTKPTVKERGNGQNNAGTYDVTVQISAPGYITKEITSQLIIKPKEITRPEVEKRLVYNDKRQKAPINIRDEHGQFQENFRLPKECRMIGDVTAIDANTADNPYVVTIKLNNKNNYVWDNGTSDDLELEWFIDKQLIDLSGTEWVYANYLYDGLSHAVSVKLGSPKHSRVIDIKYSGDNREQRDVGVYHTKVELTIKDLYKNNYAIAPGSTYPSECEWSIYHDRIPDRIEVDSLEFEYNGTTQHPVVLQESLDSILTDATISYSDDGKKDVGQHRITITVTKKGLEPLVKTIYYEIKPKKVGIPTIKPENQRLAYNASEQKAMLEVNGISIDFIEKYLTDYVSIFGNIYGIEPNKHEIVIDLKDKKNLVWSDGTVDTKTTFWEITKIDLANLDIKWDYDAVNKIEYNGETQFVKLNVGKQNGINVTYTNNSGKNAGDYHSTAKIELLYSDENMYENIGSFDSVVKDYALDWQIKKQQIDASTVMWSNREFIYMETPTHINTTYTVDLLNMPTTLVRGVDYTITGNTFNVTGDTVVDFKQPLEQEAVLNILNPNIELSGFALTRLAWKVVYNPILGIEYNDETYIYNELGAYDPIKIKGYLGDDALVTYYPNNVVKNVGVYPQRVEITKPGFTCFAKDVILTVKPMKIDKPSITNNVHEFNGKIQDCGLENLSIYTLKGNLAEFKPGKYNVTVGIKKVMNEVGQEVYNYIWRDTVEGAEPEQVKLSWEITKLDFSIINSDFNYTAPFEYDGKEHSVELKTLPAGLVAEYTTYLVGQDVALLDNPVNHGDYKTVVTIKTVFEDSKALIEECYTQQAIDAINAFNGKEQQWSIAQKVIDMQEVAWKTFDVKNEKMAPTIYQKNYHGEETLYEARLINLPEEFKSKISFANNRGSAISQYTAVATIYDAEDNYKLNGLKIAAKQINGDKIFEYQWEIYENNIDGWLFFEAEQEARYTFKKDSVESESLQPTLTILQPQLNGSEVEQLIKDNVIKVEFPGEGFQAQAVNNVGTYQYLTRIIVPGFAISEKIVTFKVKPARIAKPTIIDNTTVKEFAYNANGVSSVFDNFSHTQNKWQNIYRMDNVTMSEIGTYIPKAVLLSNNFIWSDGTTDENAPNFALNDTAEDLTFTNSTGTTYTWSIKKI